MVNISVPQQKHYCILLTVLKIISKGMLGEKNFVAKNNVLHIFLEKTIRIFSYLPIFISPSQLFFVS